LAVAEVDNLVGEAEEGGRIAGKEGLSLPQAKDQGAAEAGGDEQAGVAAADDGQTVGTLELSQGLADGFDQIAIKVGGDEVSDDLGIGIAAENEAIGLELLAEGGVVFDDAVVDDGKIAVAAEVGVGVGVGGGSVCG
jgi:hypothetical protein